MSSLAAIDGLISDWPPCTARTTSATSSSGMSLSRYPLAPARIASKRSSSSSLIVSMTIFELGATSFIARHASMPLLLGIRMSIRTTSGSDSPAFSTASVPSLASPTSSMSSSAARTISSPRRNSA